MGVSEKNMLEEGDNHEGFLHLEAEHGPFHIIGDVHGCFAELLALLLKLEVFVQFSEAEQRYTLAVTPAAKLLFVGDLVDRGPNSPEVLRLVMDLVEQGAAYCVSGNHDDKLFRLLLGHKVQVRHGLELTVAQMAGYDQAFHLRVRNFLGSLPHHIILDGGRLVIAHAGLEERLHGRHSKGIRALCLYGPTNGNLDEKGLPVRLDWAADYCGKAVVVYGHTPVQEPFWRNNTLNIDTGCVFGGSLTALSYPSNQVTTVKSLATYSEPVRPFLPSPHARVPSH